MQTCMHASYRQRIKEHRVGHSLVDGRLHVIVPLLRCRRNGGDRLVEEARIRTTHEVDAARRLLDPVTVGKLGSFMHAKASYLLICPGQIKKR